MRGKIILGLMGAGVLGIFACSSDAPDDSAQKAQDKFVSDFCDVLVDPTKVCCQKGLNLTSDKTVCVKAVVEVEPAMLKDEAARTACLAQLKAASPLADFCTDFGNLDLPACPDLRRKLLTGTKKAGEPCATDIECAPDYGGPVACKGVCQVTKRGKEGDGPCVATVEASKVVKKQKADAEGASAIVCYMRDTLSCDEATKKCIKPKELGGDCTDHDSCIRTAYCDDTTKKCTVRRPRGASCSTDRQCQAPLNCDATFCRDDVAEGAACERAEQCATDICGDGKKCEKVGIDTRLEAVCRVPQK
jgi:hypothetical protein